MKHICYIYIYKYKKLENIGVSFDPTYQYEMSEDKLKIKKSKQSIPESFWGSHIKTFSAIIGENGAGKSTLLELIFHICASGSDSRDVDVIIVYAESNVLKAYVPKDRSVSVSVDGIEICSSQQPEINATYYTGYFSPYYNYNHPRDIELSGSFNMSDGYLLIKDLQNYSNIDTLHLTENLRMHFETHIAQDNARIVCMLANKELRERLLQYNLPEYIIIKPNLSGYYAISRNDKNRYNGIEIPHCPSPIIPTASSIIKELIYYNFLNIIAEDPNHKIVSYLNLWVECSDMQSDILTQFESFIEKNVRDEMYSRLLLHVHGNLKEMQEICNFSDEYRCWYRDINSPNLGSWLLRIYKSHDYIVARNFDIVYSKGKDPNTRLSTGELVVLKLFSRLFYVLTLKYEKASNFEPAKLLLLDEAEIGFHPEWQRQFINNLVDFVNAVVKEEEDPVQIILTSHSPFLLSDIPSECATFMKNDKGVDGSNKTVVVDSKEVSSFGANLYDLFKTGYFMQSSIGMYAQNKIKRIYDIYNKGNSAEKQEAFLTNYEELYYIINNISDPFIAHDAKEKFYQLSKDYCKEDLKSRLLQEITDRQEMISKL